MMEDYSGKDIDQEEVSPWRNFLRGEFLTEWRNKRRTPETNAAHTIEKPAPKLGELAYLAHDKEPPAREMPIEAPADLAMGGTAVFGGELQRQRDEAHLRRKLVGLKMGAQDLQTEQQEIRQKQDAFGDELPSPDSDQATHLAQETVEPNPLPPQHLEVTATTAEEERLRQLAMTSPEVKPAVIEDTVKEAAELNIPIESVYEWRHEHKDEADDMSSAVQQTPQPTKPKPAAVQPYRSSSTYKQSTSDSKTSRPSQSPTADEPAGSIYRQAVIAGFWTAIVLVIVGLILLIIAR